MKRSEEASKSKIANFVRITHRDEVEPPFTDWLHEAYAYVEKRKTVKKPRQKTRRSQDQKRLSQRQKSS